jgi:hypothetical protein
VLFVSICLLGGLVAGLFIFRDPLARLGTVASKRLSDGKSSVLDNAGDGIKLSSKGAVFPRRLLAISVNDYLYANPVSAGPPGRGFHALLDRLTTVLHIPPSQVIALGDRASGQTAPHAEGKKAEPSEKTAELPPSQDGLPLKPVIEKTISEFLDSSRSQDRIVVLFAGHIIEIGEEAFLVPLEGELGVKETLIPVSWLYAKLEGSKARQKVLMVDTCRLNPGRGLERPGSGPMKARLNELLQKPPPGVQVWSACAQEQYSYEFDDESVFLRKLYEALTPDILQTIQQPADSLPLEALAEVVNKGTTSEVATQVAIEGKKGAQTPRLVGQERPDGAPYDKDEPLAPLVVIQRPPVPSGGVADQRDVRSILQEIDLPPIKMAQERSGTVAIETIIPFSAEVLQTYRPDYGSMKEIKNNPDKFPLRVKIINTIELLRKHFDPKENAGSLREHFGGGNNDKIKAEILKEQLKPAHVQADLKDKLDELRKAGVERDKEPSKRWQAHYDYILAQLLARTAYVDEYNLMLGKIRKDELPPLEVDQTGYRLSSRERLQSTKEVKDMAAEAQKLFAKLAREHPGTPWEILAKRARLNALGLEWQPIR